MGAFLCQHEASKITNTIVRNYFSSVVYRACNITHTIEKPIAALSVSSEKKFPLVSMRNVKNVMKCISVAYVDSRKKHFDPPHDKTNKVTSVPSDDSDQPGHMPSLIRVFAVRSMDSLGPNFASGGQR